MRLGLVVATYRRPDILKTTLTHLFSQPHIPDHIVISAVNSTDIPDLGPNSGKVQVLFGSAGLTAQRNKGLGYLIQCTDVIAFIDDDEFPCREWLLTLFTTCREHKVDGVLGPVLRHFDQAPPKWLEKSNFYVRRVNPTGMPVEWLEARTGNVLLKRELVAGDPAPFRPEFRAGEDQDFFRRKIGEGRKFIWCAEAEAFETVPPARWNKKYLLRKALLRGATAGLHTNVVGVVKSVVAIPLYTLALPFALVAGQQYFMTLLVKICDHLGKLLILVGINPVREEYVLDTPS